MLKCPNPVCRAVIEHVDRIKVPVTPTAEGLPAGEAEFFSCPACSAPLSGGVVKDPRRSGAGEPKVIRHQPNVIGRRYPPG
jgi:hypothetical protein